jgi:hypothetical protein
VVRARRNHSEKVMLARKGEDNIEYRHNVAIDDADLPVSTSFAHGND